MPEKHFPFLQRCLQLALEGAGNVAPNPMVGAVLVHQGTIIGEGFHRAYGEAHAEVNAIASVAEVNRPLIPGSTLYVSLEPCNHFGKTPPCSHLVVNSGIAEVVYGIRDPFEQVNGSGLAYLEAHGIQVTGPVLENESAFLNRRFFCFHQQKRPYYILKWAESADGFMAAANKARTQISSPHSASLTHRWRAEEMAILVGAGTVHFDDPALDVRAWKGKNPLRLVWDPKLSLGAHYRVFTDGNPTVRISNETLGITADQNISAQETIEKLSAFLFAQNIQSVLVEGGKSTLELFLESGIWDEIRVIRSPLELQEGLSAPRLHLKPDETFVFSDDTYSIYHSKPKP